ncbi:MAG: hypothetical protein N4A54_00515 [Peptostreptococcaceae bacterium]|jgi:hypothetical protein|nr:hypothetical protein [Peptostreptococcaceae bacterium]
MAERKFKKYEYTYEEQMKKYGNYYEIMGSVVLGPHSEEIIKVYPKRGRKKTDDVRNFELFLKSKDGKYEMFLQGFNYGKSISVFGPFVYEDGRESEGHWLVNKETPIVGEGFIKGTSYLRGQHSVFRSAILDGNIRDVIKGVKLVRIDIDGDVLKLVYRNETGERVNPMFLLRGYGF